MSVSRRSLFALAVTTICLTTGCGSLVRVTAPDGTPVFGALVIAETASTTMPTVMTNASGEATLRWTSGFFEYVSVDHPAYERATLQAPGHPPYEFELRPATNTHPAWAPDDRIVFASSQVWALNLYSMRPDGTAVVMLTNNLASDTFPAISPDGSTIAFASDRDGNREIYVMPIKGGDQQRLTSDAAVDDQPAWSEDGAAILFWSDRGGPNRVYSIPRAGGRPTAVTGPRGEVPPRQATGAAMSDGFPGSRPGDRHATINRDGTRIAFVADVDGIPQIHTINADGTDRRRLTGP
ncbi:MAG: TolB family protein [Planctomycetota bacterium]|jgi:hypothetical protein